MSRRAHGQFALRANSYFDTPVAGVVPLLRYLPPGLKYAEPCAAAGALIDVLPGKCVFACDIDPQRSDVRKADALKRSHFGRANMIITNPPWERDILHRMIVHFSDRLPTWLLFDANWLWSKQARAFWPRLRMVVPVGRLKWIPDSAHDSGFEDAAWYFFGAPTDELPVIAERAA